MTYTQDLHIHTVFSHGDSAVVEQQTISLIAGIRHAEIIGISDHFEFLGGDAFQRYEKEVTDQGFLLGTEVSDQEYAREAAAYPFDYYVYHCADKAAEYRGAEILLATGKPVIIAHPMVLGTDLAKVSDDCTIEISNRYAWKGDFRSYFTPYLDFFRFVVSSDAHTPGMLSQEAARYIMRSLGISETILFPTSAEV